MLFIWGWSQLKDITHLMGRNSFIVNIVWENVIAQHLLQNIFEAICCSRQGAVVNWVVWQEKRQLMRFKSTVRETLNHRITFLSPAKSQQNVTQICPLCFLDLLNTTDVTSVELSVYSKYKGSLLIMYYGQ